MILKASQRAGAARLGAHLLRGDENERVEVHEVRGFLAGDVMGAMREAQAVARGTRCTQHIFSVSLNPPQAENVGIEAFEDALARIEERTGLTDQPRIVVFHEKEGRRHCHAAWSRIDAERMTAVPLPFFKTRLRELSRELYLEHGWSMPRGLMDSKARDPHNFSLEEWQQAKRIGRDPRALKSIVQECWAVSDSAPAFAKALEERGLYLAKGDRRGAVALTYEGEALSIARYAGKTAKEVRARLGAGESLRSIEDAKAHIARMIEPKLRGFMREAEETRARQMAPLEERRQSLKDQHALERERMDAGIRARAEAEGRTRAERLRTGVGALWDRLRGEYARIRKANEREAYAALNRDREQRQALIAAQMEDRQRLQREIVAVRQRHAARMLELHRDLGRAQSQPERDPPSRTVSPQDRLDRLRGLTPQQDRSRDFGFER